MAKAVKKVSSKKVSAKTAPVKKANKVIVTKANLEKEFAKVKEEAKKKALATVEMMMAKRDQLIEEAIAEAARKFEKLFGVQTNKTEQKAPAKKAKAAPKKVAKKVAKKKK